MSKDKKIDKTRVLVATFPVAHADQARKIITSLDGVELLRNGNYVSVVSAELDVESARELCNDIKSKGYNPCLM